MPSRSVSAAPVAFVLSCTLVVIGGPLSARAQDCAFRWDPEFGNPGLGGQVRALKVHDDGSGAALFAAGRFTRAPGDIAANSIAKWNGRTWAALGEGLTGSYAKVSAIAPWNHQLYVGGYFALAGSTSVSNIASWDGTTWAGVGGGTDYDVLCLAGADATSPIGPALYAGGGFPTAGGITANGIARWNGTTWSAMGSGLGYGRNYASAYALLITGNNLYAGGWFGTMNGSLVRCIARWDGTTWSDLAGGMMGSIFAEVSCLALFHGQLHAGGDFTTAGGVSCSNLARWNGSAWSPVISGTGGDPNWQSVNALAVYNDGSGSGPALYVGGRFVLAGSKTVAAVAKWDGATWSRLGTFGPFWGTRTVSALAAYIDGGHSALYAGGEFNTVAGRTAFNIARRWCIPLESEACCIGDGTCQDADFNQCTTLGGQAQGLATSCATADCPPQACCMADGTCEDFSLRRCAAAAGTTQGVGTRCSNSLCTRACCLPDNRCRDLTAEGCAATGGIAQDAGTTCSNTLCTGACCLPGNRCVDLTAAWCAAQNGRHLGQGTRCSSLPCPQACCFLDSSCREVPPDACRSAGGLAGGEGSRCLTSTACMGACCFPDTNCLDRNFSQCIASSGVYQGYGTTCASTDCPHACCFTNNTTCQHMTSAACTTSGGVPQSEGTSCSAAICGAHACCFENGDCRDIGTGHCAALGGTSEPPGRTCAGTSCPPPEACCMPLGGCSDSPPLNCEGRRGQPQGPGTTCADGTCANPCQGVVFADFTGDYRIDGRDIPGFVYEFLSPEAPDMPGFCRANLYAGDHEPEMLGAADVNAFVECLLDISACP